MEDCLFCKIAAGDIPSKKLYEDEQVVAFYDIAPQAKVHFLVIPKKHIPSAAALTEEDGALLGHEEGGEDEPRDEHEELGGIAKEHFQGKAEHGRRYGAQARRAARGMREGGRPGWCGWRTMQAQTLPGRAGLLARERLCWRLP